MRKLSWCCFLAACLSCLSLTLPANADELLPGILDVTPIPGAHVVSDCGPIILPSDRRAGNIACAYFLDEHGNERMGMNGPSAETLNAWLKAMDDAGWHFAHLAVYEFYFERPKAGTDCSDVVMMVALPDVQVRALVESSPSNGPYDGRPWRAFAIPAGTSEACGDSRHLG
ncbi:MAG: hypothetical protein HY054_06580 [Proteobacteria bacterium]|nr:hypothetical protein [Pseudomonadota bacterium]